MYPRHPRFSEERLRSSIWSWTRYVRRGGYLCCCLGSGPQWSLACEGSMLRSGSAAPPAVLPQSTRASIQQPSIVTGPSAISTATRVSRSNVTVPARLKNHRRRVVSYSSLDDMDVCRKTALTAAPSALTTPELCRVPTVRHLKLFQLFPTPYYTNSVTGYFGEPGTPEAPLTLILPTCTPIS